MLLVIQLTERLRGGIISPILSLFIRGEGLTVSQIGLLGTAGMLGWFIFEPIAGVVADRIRKKYLVAFAIVVSSFIYVAYPYANGFWSFAFLAFSMASVMSAYAVSVKALTAELLPTSERGKAYGRFVSVVSLGGIVSPVVGGLVYELLGGAFPFYLSALIGIGGLLAVSKLGYDDLQNFNGDSEDHSEKVTIWNVNLLGIFLIRAMFIFNLVFRQHTLPIFLHEDPRYRASESQIGLYMGMVSLSSALSQFIIGDLNDKLGSKFLIVSSLALSGFSYVGLVGVSGIPALLLIGVFQGTFFAAANLSMMVYLMDIMPVGRTGIVMGMYSEAENIGGILAAPSLGWIYDSLGPWFSVLSVAGVLMFNSLLSMLLVRKNQKENF